jgi:hypothetical protein
MATLSDGFRSTFETLSRMIGIGPATSSMLAPKKEKDVATREIVKGARPTSVMRRDMVDDCRTAKWRFDETDE